VTAAHGFDQDSTFVFVRLVPTVLDFFALLVLVWLTRE
jgi:hypothetical protein